MPDSTQQIRSTQERTFALTRSREGDRTTYSASLSSETPVQRWFGSEILSHAEGAVNLDRAARGLPLLFNHDINEPLGQVRKVRLDGDRLRGELVFGNRAKAKEIRQEIDDELLGDVSISYSIDEYNTTTDANGHDTVTVTRWTVLEASVVTVPADSSVGIGRHIERTHAMPTATVTPIAAERERIALLEDMFGMSRHHDDQRVQELRKACVQDGSTWDQARSKLAALVTELDPRQTPSTRLIPDDVFSRFGHDPYGMTSQGHITAGRDRLGEFAAACTDRLCERAGIPLKDPHPARRDVGSTPLQMAEQFLRATGARVPGTPQQIVHAALGNQRGIGLGTTDFTGILANVSSKALLAGWDSSAETWATWCRKGNADDFKRANRTGLSTFSRLDQIPEAGEYKYGAPTDRTEYMQVVTYGKLFSVTRQAIINDDLQAFAATPRMMGRAAGATIGDTVYDLLTTASGLGPTLNQDSVALFNAATHLNYDASSGGITVDNIDAARKTMRLQKDPNTLKPLNIGPKYLLVPAALETAAGVLIASEKNPNGLASATGGAVAANPFYNNLTVIVDPRLDGKTNGTTAWYLLADQNQFDTFEIAFLGGQETPYLETRDGWSVDGVEYKVRIDAGVTALDFRGMYRRRGA